MGKNVWFIIIVGAVAFLELLVFLMYGGGWQKMVSYLHQSPMAAGIILFEGDKCLNCDKVETFIKNNAVEKKVTFTRLEVFHSATNAGMLADRAQACGLDGSQIGVPFLWDGKNCVIGYVDVIQFFRAKLASKAIIR